MKLPEKNIEVNQVKNVMISFKGFLSDKSEIIAVTAWANGEGFDVDIDGILTQVTWDQWKALKVAVKRLAKES